MPTKLNRAGNQQNYVPSGNGDASGEYGDNATGSNIHFKVFKKPEDEGKPKSEKEIVEYQRQKLKDYYKSKDLNAYMLDAYYKAIDSYDEKELLEAYYGEHPEERPKKEKNYDKNIDNFLASKRISPSRRNLVRESFNYGQQEYKDIMALAINNNDDFTIGIARKGSKCEYTIYQSGNITASVKLLSEEQYKNDDSHSQGGTFYHEMGHAIDCMYAPNKTRWNYTLSDSFITSSGKTLNGILTSIDSETLNSRFKQAKEEFDSFDEKIAKELGYNIEDLDKENAEIKTKMQEISDSFNKVPEIAQLKEQQSQALFKRDTNSFLELSNQVQSKYQDFLKNTDYEKLNKRQDEILEKRFEIKNNIRKKGNKNIVFGDISDMFGMTGRVGSRFPFGMGHEEGYGTDAIAHEFFAECCSAEATNPESLKMIKKYFPEGYKAFTEIKEYIKEQQK